MRRSAVVVLLLAVAVAGVAGCDRGQPASAVVRLDGSPRIPDDEGIATELTTKRITLDGKRSYRVSARLMSFSTYTGAVEPMLGRRGQYVQIGLDRESGDDVMVWMAGIAQVVPGAKPSVYYTGVLVDMQEHDGARLAVFRDGTVFSLEDGVEPPKPPVGVTVEIDPDRHAAVALTPRR